MFPTVLRRSAPTWCCFRVLVVVTLLFAALHLLSGCAGSTPGGGTGNGGNGGDTDASLGEAEVSFPGDGVTLMSVAEQDGVGSATYEGTLVNEEVVLSAITTDTGEGTMQIELDEQQRPTQVTLNALTLLITYSGESEGTYQVLEDGVARFSGTLQVGSPPTQSPPDMAAMRVLRRDIENCAAHSLTTKAREFLVDTLHEEPSEQDTSRLTQCAFENPTVRELFLGLCVVTQVLQNRLERVQEECSHQTMPSGRCQLIVQATRRALTTYTFYAEPAMCDALLQLWQQEPACRGGDEARTGCWEFLYSSSDPMVNGRRAALQIDGAGNVVREWALEWRRVGTFTEAWLERQRYDMTNTPYFASCYTSLSQSVIAEPSGTGFRISTSMRGYATSYDALEDSCVIQTDVPALVDTIYSNLVFDAESEDRMSGQFELYLQSLDDGGDGPSEYTFSGTITATRTTCPPPGALSQEEQGDACWVYR